MKREKKLENLNKNERENVCVRVCVCVREWTTWLDRVRKCAKDNSVLKILDILHTHVTLIHIARDDSTDPIEGDRTFAFVTKWMKWRREKREQDLSFGDDKWGERGREIKD